MYICIYICIYIYIETKNAPIYVRMDTYMFNMCMNACVYTNSFQIDLDVKKNFDHIGQFHTVSHCFTPFHTVSPCASFAARFRQRGASLGWLMPAVKPCSNRAQTVQTYFKPGHSNS